MPSGHTRWKRRAGRWGFTRALPAAGRRLSPDGEAADLDSRHRATLQHAGATGDLTTVESRAKFGADQEAARTRSRFLMVESYAPHLERAEDKWTLSRC